MEPRIIPVMLLQGEDLVKTRKFRKPTYIGDPINALRIYNDLGTDELVVLDITASHEGRGPRFDFLEELASEAFMPLSYGGGVTNIDQARQIYAAGFEKVSINHAANQDHGLIRDLADEFGRQSVVGAIDVQATRSGLMAVDHVTKKNGRPAMDAVLDLQEQGAGEVFVQWMDRDGSMNGYDQESIVALADALDVPLVVCGGAGTTQDLEDALHNGVSGAAAGSMFVFNGRRRGVLISYPDDDELERLHAIRPTRLRRDPSSE